MDYILHDPAGLHGMGEYPEETLKSLEEPFGVAQSIIQLRKEKGESLPPEITPCGAGKAA